MSLLCFISESKIVLRISKLDRYPSGEIAIQSLKCAAFLAILGTRFDTCKELQGLGADLIDRCR